ncbi:MAG: hypothetical protein HY923_09550 [Elusimicrobia bacterium]|nr:hypothetical protein [Elusimicrobiota bacterium]
MEHRCLSPWKGAVVGGLIAFVWTPVSWIVLPFHQRTVRALANPAAVVRVLEAGSIEPGTYRLAPEGEGNRLEQPTVFLSYSRPGTRGTAASLLAGLAAQMIGAFFWTWILGKIPGLTLKDAAMYGLFFGLCLGTLGAIPNAAWGNFSWSFAAVQLVDAAILWTLASMALSRCYARACALPA